MNDEPLGVLVNRMYDAFKAAESEVDFLSKSLVRLGEHIESAIDDPVRALFFLEQVAVVASTANAAIGWLPDNLKAISDLAGEVSAMYEDEDARRQFEIDEQRRLVQVSRDYL